MELTTSKWEYFCHECTWIYFFQIDFYRSFLIHTFCYAVFSTADLLNISEFPAASVSFDFLDNLGGTSNPNLSIHSSNSNLNQSSSISSLSSKKPLKKRLSVHNNQRVKFSSKSLEKDSVQPHAASTPRSLVEGKYLDRHPKQHGVDPHQLTEALTPIREQTTEGKDKQDKKHRKGAISANTSNSLTFKTRTDHATVKTEVCIEGLRSVVKASCGLTFNYTGWKITALKF